MSSLGLEARAPARMGFTPLDGEILGLEQRRGRGIHVRRGGEIVEHGPVGRGVVGRGQAPRLSYEVAVDIERLLLEEARAVVDAEGSAAEVARGWCNLLEADRKPEPDSEREDGRESRPYRRGRQW